MGGAYIIITIFLSLAVVVLSFILYKTKKKKSVARQEDDVCAPQMEESEVDLQKIISQKGRILLVVDSKKTLDNIAVLLSEDYILTKVDSSHEALNYLKSNEVDIVISNAEMSPMSGIELCSRIKSNFETSHIQVILITAFNDKDTLISGLEAGVTDYLFKPLNERLLLLRVKNILEDRQRLRRSFLGYHEEDSDYTSASEREFMEKVTTIVSSNLANPDFMIGDLCFEIGMSRTAFFKKLKSLSGLAPNDFVRTYRMSKAKEMLKNPKYNVTEISELVGFSDPKYFSVCFKKQFGVSPSKYN